MTTRDTSGDALAEALQGREGDVAFWMGRSRQCCPFANDGPERDTWLKKWDASAAEARTICLQHREPLLHQRTIRGAMANGVDCLSRVMRLAKLPPSLKLDVQNTRAGLEQALQYAPAGPLEAASSAIQSSGSG